MFEPVWDFPASIDQRTCTNIRDFLPTHIRCVSQQGIVDLTHFPAWHTHEPIFPFNDYLCRYGAASRVILASGVEGTTFCQSAEEPLKNYIYITDRTDGFLYLSTAANSEGKAPSARLFQTMLVDFSCRRRLRGCTLSFSH